MAISISPEGIDWTPTGGSTITYASTVDIKANKFTDCNTSLLFVNNPVTTNFNTAGVATAAYQNMDFTISCNDFIKNYTGQMYGIYVESGTNMVNIGGCTSVNNPNVIPGGNGWPITGDKQTDLPSTWASPTNWYSIYDAGSNGGFLYHYYFNEYIGNPIASTVFPTTIVSTGLGGARCTFDGFTNDGINPLPTCVDDVSGNIVFTRPSSNGGNNGNGKYDVIGKEYKVKENYLGQNQPNPFTGQVLIQYHLVSTVQQAQLEIFELVSGRKLQTLHLNTAESQVQLDLSKYTSGMYMYRLIADDQLIDTKLMIKVK